MLVEGFEFLIPTLTCDPKDRHVLAAAIQGRAATTVTVNLRDFPRASLAPFGITAEHPDTFLLRLFVAHASDEEKTLVDYSKEASERLRLHGYWNGECPRQVGRACLDRGSGEHE